jgi:hypothetical protein
MSSAGVGLFHDLFDDAGLFPPSATSVAQAVAAHARHRVSWYDDLVASFVSNDARLIKVDACARRLGLPVVDVTVVVPAGLPALPDALATVRRCPRLRMRSVEVALGPAPMAAAARAAAMVAEYEVPLYVEVPGPLVTDTRIHQLRTHGMRLKLRAGGTSIAAFTPESRLAPMIVDCAAELLPFTCVTGVSRAVRHRDPATLRERHGFANLALATLTAVTTASEAAVRLALAERDPHVVVDRLVALTPRDVGAVRTLLTRVGSSHVSESIADLTALGLVAAT